MTEAQLKLSYQHITFDLELELECEYSHEIICPICLFNEMNGILVWCSECGHGGHLSHLNEWFLEFNECPTGCGHFCVFNN